MADAQSLFAELDATLSRASTARQASLLRRVTALFISSADNLRGDHVVVFDDVIGRIVERSERDALVELSAKLAPIPNAPVNVLARLSRDNDIAVSGPIIANSAALGDELLAEIASTKGPKHLAAIAGRAALSEAVTDAFIERADSDLLRKVVAQPSARFSELGFVKLINRAKSDKALAAAIAARADVPAELQPFLKLSLVP